jgi:hypothetical protein
MKRWERFKKWKKKGDCSNIVWCENSESRKLAVSLSLMQITILTWQQPIKVVYNGKLSWEFSYHKHSFYSNVTVMFNLYFTACTWQPTSSFHVFTIEYISCSQDVCVTVCYRLDDLWLQYTTLCFLRRCCGDVCSHAWSSYKDFSCPASRVTTRKSRTYDPSTLLLSI